MILSFETDRAQLEKYIPEEFELTTPEVQVAFNQLTEINWLAGGQYNLINVTAPVRFHGKKDRLDGAYPLVVWENKTAPILTGREQTGIPKIYADIEDLRIVRPYFATTASYEGTTFLTMQFEATGPKIDKELDRVKSQFKSMDTFGWRYIPKVGAPGAELSQLVLFPQRMEVETALAGKGSLRWTELPPMQDPSQSHIISCLASIPTKKVTQAVLAEGEIVLHAAGGRVVE